MVVNDNGQVTTLVDLLFLHRTEEISLALQVGKLKLSQAGTETQDMRHAHPGAFFFCFAQLGVVSIWILVWGSGGVGSRGVGKPHTFFFIIDSLCRDFEFHFYSFIYLFPCVIFLISHFIFLTILSINANETIPSHT